MQHLARCVQGPGKVWIQTFFFQTLMTIDIAVKF